jgi:hypothetical protein
MLRLVQELSFFWPLNAVMVGIFAAMSGSIVAIFMPPVLWRCWYMTA